MAQRENAKGAAAVNIKELREDFDYPSGTNAARHLNGQALPRELVDHREALEGLTIRACIKDEVVCPNLILGGGRQRPGPVHSNPLAGPLARNHGTAVAQVTA